MNKLVIAWDLDGTLICSQHRQKNKEDGSFDLDYWIETAEELTKEDTLLPLVQVYQAYKDAGFYQVAVTAREMHPWDYDFLKSHGLEFDEILHRDGSTDLDHILKDLLLDGVFAKSDKIPFQAYDDKQDNLDTFDKWGFRTFHATYLNAAMAADNRDSIPFKPADAVKMEGGADWAKTD